MISRKKILSLGATVLLGISAVQFAVPRMIHNLMSHAGYQEAVMDYADPRNYITRGPYRGLDYSLTETNDPETEDDKLDSLDKLEEPLQKIDLNAIYLGLQENPLPKSPSKPSKLSNAADIEFYSIRDFIPKPELLVGESLLENLFIDKKGLEKIQQLKLGEVINLADIADSNYWSLPTTTEIRFSQIDLGNFTLSFGRDEQGIYTSIYDIWDFAPTSGYFKVAANKRTQKAVTLLSLIGTPIHFYDRFYWDNTETN